MPRWARLNADRDQHPAHGALGDAVLIGEGLESGAGLIGEAGGGEMFGGEVARHAGWDSMSGGFAATCWLCDCCT
jgi:hypothetical protein